MKLCLVAWLVVQLLHVLCLNVFYLGFASSSSSPSSPKGHISFSLSDLISESSTDSSSSCSSSNSEDDVSGSGETGTDSDNSGGGGTGGNGGQDHEPAHVGGDCSGCGSCYDPHAVCVEFGCNNICVCEPGYTFIKNGAFKCGQCLPECSCDDGDSCPCGECEKCEDGKCVPGCIGCEVCVPGNGCVKLGPGDDCTLHPHKCCRDDLTCRNGICECEDENLQNDEDEDKCLGDDLGEPCDNNDETDPCTDKDNRTECGSDGNPVCICSDPYVETNGICFQIGDICGPKGDANACLRDIGIKCRSADCCGNANGNPNYPCNVKYCVCDTEWGFQLNATENGCVHSGLPVVPHQDCADMVYE
ncbi:tenascin-X-like isoform X2 [Mya arenaria]|uniref:tenascin-X-like isoform X2 n=1 Tax=Mya arenaria TaxID=6604 RepID=UPI0022E35470|nr:tenascin-X-like isoform X2 [Mya arenaria]